MPDLSTGTGPGGERGQYLRGAFPAGLAPEALAVGDFNRDGAPDVAVLSSDRSQENPYRVSPGKVSVLLNDGQGGLGAPTLRASLRSAQGGLAAGDLDADGVQDLLVGTRWGAAMLRGQQDGWFQVQPFGLGGGVSRHLGILPGSGSTPPLGWAAGSIDGKDVPQNRPGMSFVRPGPAGTFDVSTPTTAQGAPVIGPYEENLVATVADVDEDGAPDIVMSAYEKPVTLVLGNGFGQYTFQPLLTTQARELETADFDGDGHVDLAVLDAQTLRIYRGDGDAGFTEASATQTVLPVDDLAVADLDADGHPDVAAVHRAAAAVTVWYGRGDGGFHSASRLAVGREPRAVAVADLDADGQRELLVVESAENTVSVYRVPPRATVENLTPPTCPVRVLPGEAPASPAPLAVFNTSYTGGARSATGDFDGNGLQDIVSQLGYDSALLILNQGNGQFVQRIPLPKLRLMGFAAGDFNRDGHDDLATITLPSDLNPAYNPEQVTFEILWGNGQGEFPTSTSYPQLAPYGMGHVVAEDLNRDGHLDLVVSVPGDCSPRTTRLLNQGNGVMIVLPPPDLGYSPYDGCITTLWKPQVVDFNRDGRPDLLHDSVELHLDFTTPSGEGTPMGALNRVWFPGTPSVGDVDDDGKLDLVVAGPDGLALQLGDGQGTPRAPLLCAASTFPGVMEARDVDGDGVTDLIGKGTKSLVLWLGAGDGAFLPARSYALEGGPDWVRSMDVLGDARPELVIMTAYGKLTVFPMPEH
nr:VCBS repeat-containing protein [Pyxidicoccus fallax]